MALDYLEKLNTGPSDKHHKRLAEALYSIIAVCFIVWAIVYVQTRSVVMENVEPPITTESIGGRVSLSQQESMAKQAILENISQDKQELTKAQTKSKADLIKQQQLLK